MRGVFLQDGSVAARSSIKLKNMAKRPGHVGPKCSTSKSCEPGLVSVGALSPNIPHVLGDPSMSNLDEVGRYYLDYYNGRICKLFIVYDSDQNPFRSLISLALEDSILLKAVLALAACHKANTSCSFYQPDTLSVQSRKAKQDALYFKCRAITEISCALHDVTLQRQDATVASIFLLVFLDLLESGSDRWNFHLEGAKRLMSLFRISSQPEDGAGQDPGRTVQRIRDFIARQLYLIETLGSTFVRPKLIPQYSSSVYAISSQETVEQSFLGCPEYLLNAIQSLSLKRDAAASGVLLDQAIISNHIQDTRRILESIQNFDCYTWASSLPQTHHSPDRDIGRLCILSESYKIGALLYGERVIEAFASCTTVQDGLACELIRLIAILKDDRTLLKCALWPICIAGLECRRQDQRNFLTGCLERFWEDTSCLNVINAAKILQKYWQQADGLGGDPWQWIFAIGCLGADWLLI
ncbi:C6 transcription factor [Paecilomyces variotii No. 5]|uniref:C6 transcription factor n=1 Tax=Byssochlamys spectabilis (strain No. 5 / NBRC 109023) TaxID=1356009 RepID=V5I5Z5_BYSSN|nr:C6 transcription factor [Paecilomyces variotii No. 5]